MWAFGGGGGRGRGGDHVEKDERLCGVHVAVTPGTDGTRHAQFRHSALVVSSRVKIYGRIRSPSVE